VHTKKLALTLEEENGYFQGFAQGKTSRVGLNPCAGLYRYSTVRRTADDAKLQHMSRCTPTPYAAFVPHFDIAAGKLNGYVVEPRFAARLATIYVLGGAGAL
jgi:hypothetical protein